jgi:hypothetical protein
MVELILYLISADNTKEHKNVLIMASRGSLDIK